MYAAMGTMFDHKCKPLFNYGTGYRNTIKWSNSGRYVALCGFGNLPGDIGACCLLALLPCRHLQRPEHSRLMMIAQIMRKLDLVRGHVD